MHLIVFPLIHYNLSFQDHVFSVGKIQKGRENEKHRERLLRLWSFLCLKEWPHCQGDWYLKSFQRFNYLYSTKCCDSRCIPSHYSMEIFIIRVIIKCILHHTWKCKRCTILLHSIVSARKKFLFAPFDVRKSIVAKMNFKRTTVMFLSKNKVKFQYGK